MNQHIQSLFWTEGMMENDSAWQSYRSNHKLTAHINERFAIWERTPEGPFLIERLYFANCFLRPDCGLIIQLSNGSEKFNISHQPEMHHGVFFWVPAFAKIKFSPVNEKDVQSTRHLSVPFCVRTITNPIQRTVEGGRYISYFSSFEQMAGN